MGGRGNHVDYGKDQTEEWMLARECVGGSGIPEIRGFVGGVSQQSTLPCSRHTRDIIVRDYIASREGLERAQDVKVKGAASAAAPFTLPGPRTVRSI